MCGFIGKISTDNINEEELKFSNRLIQCRGPDSKKNEHFKENEFNFSLIFNRLSILDLSENADQPMSSNDGNSVLMFNGEIFNHQDLRKELETKNIKFNTNHSDSEVILHGLEYFGKKFISQLRGQFSIFYINKRKKTILLARDRVGQKPLYYHLSNNNLVIGSNLIAVSKLVHNKTISQSSINEYLMCGVISSPNTIFENIQKLKPAEIIEIGYEDKLKIIDSEIFWKLANFVDNKPFQSDEFFSILSDSISIRNLADVPIANFLSGGIDSTAIIKNTKNFSNNINTFNVEIDNKKYDESHWAKLVSKKYETNHTSIKLSSNISVENVLAALESLDEPYSDPSLIPSFLISKEMSKKYKVAISGDGGDELLGGYKRFQNSLINSNNLKSLFSKIYDIYPPFLGTGNFFASKSDSLETRYKSYLEDNKLSVLLNSYISETKIESLFKENLIDDDYKLLQLLEYKFFLSEMMMFKVDRSSMANSLEVRSPFVDHLLIEYILSHTNNYYSPNKPKKILSDYLLEDFGLDFVQRKKQGFVFDIENWVFKNLDLIKEVINNGTIIKSMNPEIIKTLTINKSRINAQRIWKLFVLENYLSRINS